MPILTTRHARILYLHVPKTGGSYVEDMLRSYGTVTGVRSGSDFGGLPCSPQHFHRPLIERVYAADLYELRDAFDYVFMTVREPLGRMKSEFRYRLRQDRGARVARRLNMPLRFDRWLTHSLRQYQRDPFMLDNHMRPQHEFVALGAEVFRLEDGLERLVGRLDEVTGLKGTVPKNNVNVSTSHRLYDYRLRDATWRAWIAHADADYRTFMYEPQRDPP
mgnify:CR=1 FL=1